jgi:hypothetical protein
LHVLKVEELLRPDQSVPGARRKARLRASGGLDDPTTWLGGQLDLGAGLNDRHITAYKDEPAMLVL